MRLLALLAAAAASLPGLLAAESSVPGDSRRGAVLFETYQCISCHGPLGRGAAAAGARTAPDLGRWTGRAFTPTTLATYLWNHAPDMWSAMDKAGLAKPALNEQQSADLFAFFYSRRYFEAPGEAGRGRQVFESGGCAKCHTLRGDAAAPGAPPPVARWTRTDDAIGFASSLWNHSSRMYAEMKKRKLDWPDLSPQQLTDLLVFARRLPGGSPLEPVVAIDTDSREGLGVFRAKGCAACHEGPKALTQFRHRTLAGLAVAMWNHAPRMTSEPPSLSADEMRQLTGYLWSISYFDEPGNAKAGARVYNSARCGTCHAASANWMAPSLESRAQPLHAIGVVSALWRHGPAMHARMREQKVAWPRFQGSEMADLIAYVNSRRP
ncbi:MAG: c-type cytochrome [Bryobacterales bacterium]|nr:c-type cytochrome [Bryobacterales bacterium]